MEAESNYEIVGEKEATSLNKNPCYGVVLRSKIQAENSRQVKSKHKMPACGTISLVGFILVGSAAFISMGISLWSISKANSSCSQLEMKQNDFQKKIMELQDNISQQIMELQNSASESSELERRLTQLQIIENNRNDIQSNISTSLDLKLNNIIQSLTGQYSNLPADSCSLVLQLNSSSPSGYYWIRSSNGSAVHVYCDFNRQCGCDGPSEWTRVAFLDMSDPNQVCPSNWTTISSPVRTCGRGLRSTCGCNSAFYSTYGMTYSHVCGHIIAYQYGGPNGYSSCSSLIDGSYIDGVSFTHGSVGSRHHIWSFVNAAYESSICACIVVITLYSKHLLWETISSVILETMTACILQLLSTLVTLSGMARDVVPPAPAASSTTLHGSARLSPSPPLMTWRSGSVKMVLMKIYLSDF